VIYTWIYDAYGPAGLLAMTFASGLLVYALVAGGSYAVFFVWGRRRFVPDYRPDAQDIRQSLRWSVGSLAGNALLFLPVQLLIVTGHSRVYDGIEPYGWGYLALSVVGALAVAETLIYWIPRALHTRWLYRTIHVHHHKFREPTPLSCVAFHPVDSFAQSFPYHLYALLVPINFWAYLALVLFVMVWTVMIHDRIRWVPGGLVNHTGCHTAHHWFQKDNYGQYFTFWDRLCGTYRDPAGLPDRFMASKVPAYRWRPATAIAPT
jgi:Delta7-sterol 5-desaturase